MKYFLVVTSLLLSSLTAFGNCNPSLLASAKTIHRLKVGGKVTIVGLRENASYKETFGCSDSNSLFVGDSVPVGECLGIPTQEQVNGEYNLNVVTCE